MADSLKRRGDLSSSQGLKRHGDLSYSQGRLENALKHYNDALGALSEEGCDSESDAVVEIYISIGRVYHDQRRFRPAIEYLQKAVDILQRGSSSSLSNMAQAYKLSGRFDDTIECLYKAIVQAQEDAQT